MPIAARIIQDSINPWTGTRLTSIECTFPRFILAEVNTHRMLSRSSASSRAIPIAKRIAAVAAEPFVPFAFGKNQKGMQASEVLGDEANEDARKIWMSACQAALTAARELQVRGVHKQHANRILEPFSWHTALITATEWSNFFALRMHPDAQPEFRELAIAMYTAMASSRPVKRERHRVYVDHDLEQLERDYATDEVDAISVGRAARLSYLTHDGVRSPDEDLRLAHTLKRAGHMSPYEHVAVAFKPATKSYEDMMFGNFRAWVQIRKTIANEDDFGRLQR